MTVNVQRGAIRRMAYGQEAPTNGPGPGCISYPRAALEGLHRVRGTFHPRAEVMPSQSSMEAHRSLQKGFHTSGPVIGMTLLKTCFEMTRQG